MEASPSRSDSFSHGWLRCKARPAAAFDRLGVDADASGLGCSFNSSSSFIDMDPEELFSMRWTSSAAAAAEDEDAEFDFGMTCAGEQCSSPLLVGAGRLLLPCEPSSAVRDGTSTTCADVTSPAFHSAQSTPASAGAANSRRVAGGAKAGAEAPLLATRRILLRYLRFLAPLCRKVRALPLRAFAPRSRAALASATSSSSTPARQSTSSYASAAECWCHGNANTAVRDAILYCKRSIQGQDM